MAPRQFRLVEAGRTGSLTLELPDIRAGAYVARVRAINVADVSSVWASSTETQLRRPGAAAGVGPAGHTIAGVRHWLRWGFPEGRFTAQRTRDLVRPDQ